MRIYLAGPFFSQEQIARIEVIEAALTQNPTVDKFFSPRLGEDGGEFPMGSPEWANKVFHLDVSEIDRADALVVVADYVADNMDSGTAFEVGYAYSHQKPIVVVHELPEPLNLMIGQALQCYLTDGHAVADLDFNNLPHQPYTGKTF